jgi:glycosyltransferase involved in cell wall biosynthesis
VCRTGTAGTAELIVEGVTGRSTPIERDAFIAAAVEFLTDQATLRRMGIAAARHVRERFTFERQLQDTLALYRRLAGRHEMADKQGRQQAARASA